MIRRFLSWWFVALSLFLITPPSVAQTWAISSQWNSPNVMSLRAQESAGAFNDTVLWAPYEGATLAVQSGTGLGFAVVAGGVLGGAAIAVAGGGDIQSATAAVVLAVVGGLVTVAAIPTGVYYGGEWKGGNGDRGWTMFGGLTGAAVTGVPILTRNEVKLGTLVPLVLLTGLAGSLLGYHASASPVLAVNPVGEGAGLHGGGIRATFVLVRF